MVLYLLLLDGVHHDLQSDHDRIHGAEAWSGMHCSVISSLEIMI